MNLYHEKVRDVVGAEALSQGKKDLKEWIDSATVSLSGSSSDIASSMFVIVCFCAVSITGTKLFE